MAAPPTDPQRGRDSRANQAPASGSIPANSPQRGTQSRKTGEIVGNPGMYLGTESRNGILYARYRATKGTWVSASLVEQGYKNLFGPDTAYGAYLGIVRSPDGNPLPNPDKIVPGQEYLIPMRSIPGREVVTFDKGLTVTGSPPPVQKPVKTQNHYLAQLEFSLRHPEIAASIGPPVSGGVNITSIAARLAVRTGLDDKKPSPTEGTEVNAVRHVTWQAIITDTKGIKTAEEVGGIHEDSPGLLDGITDVATARFSTVSQADTAADLMNNPIGRSIALLKPKLSPKGYALEALAQFQSTGLWVVSKNADGTFSATQVKLPPAQYQKAVGALKQLDDLGFNAAENAATKRDRERRETKQGPF